MAGKIIILSAPSGCGKSTIIGRLLQHPELRLHFSVSATNRQPREGETHGVHYYFLSTDEMQRRIANGEFLEHEEVYAGRYYGTLLSEIDRITDLGDNIIMDLDVQGALNVKRQLPDRVLTIFIEPPSVATLQQRLEARGTDSAEEIARRVAKAEIELADAPAFDCSIVNDDLDCAVAETLKTIENFVA